jgi:hypothetical protein
MTSKAILRRLNRLTQREMPKAPRVLEILVTSIGKPDKKVELILGKSRSCGPVAWQTDREGER